MKVKLFNSEIIMNNFYNLFLYSLVANIISIALIITYMITNILLFIILTTFFIFVSTLTSFYIIGASYNKFLDKITELNVAKKISDEDKKILIEKSDHAKE